jgi:hypothetical protein
MLRGRERRNVTEDEHNKTLLGRQPRSGVQVELGHLLDGPEILLRLQQRRRHGAKELVGR